MPHGGPRMPSQKIRMQMPPSALCRGTTRLPSQGGTPSMTLLPGRGRWEPNTRRRAASWPREGGSWPGRGSLPSGGQERGTSTRPSMEGTAPGTQSSGRGSTSGSNPENISTRRRTTSWPRRVGTCSGWDTNGGELVYDRKEPTKILQGVHWV